MSNELQPQQAKEIQKSDILSSAAITAIMTFIMLTWSKNLPADSVILPYITEQTISFIAGITSYSVTIILTLLRYEVRLLIYKRKYTKKIQYLDHLIAISTCPVAKKDLENRRSELLIDAAKSIINEDL
ncbi:hypothetical protein [Aeromonas veronii]